ncbi:PH domain-containing protein [Sphingomonas sanxanigenens]|uniref:YdbS-like PH domain-containing protein n=1 Tax=Sphingomonas sanxanigenens DSM 19645 = NX02 TaxID=1123269 RepID=W0ABG6_9SPHN|nr:PH domain-containing protein [Sphingomonas sanxanigenens]AHE53847.1 hypothetical protein NX02_10650 [Sphingomonas sanxanigenens DSM 19645 = NX02]
MMTRLEPGQLWVMRIRAAILGCVLIVPAIVGGFFIQSEFGWPAWLPPLVGAVLLVWPVLIAPGRRFAAWGYEEDADALLIAHGVWTEVRTVVPFKRVQHIDVAQGPIERGFGVAQLVLHTAGTAHSLVVLPGLARDAAEAMRDRIRSHIRQEPE